MLNILKHKGNTIYYKCSCGTQGMCSVKPIKDTIAIVVDVVCPVCKETERITLLQYQTEEDKSMLLRDFDNVDLTWVPSFNEEV